MTTGALDHFRELIVVLGAGLLPDGTAAPSTLRRAERAAELARERRGSAVILSGSRSDHPAERPAKTEAQRMVDVLRAARIPTERLFVEEESRETLWNAALVADHFLRGLSPRPITLVTSPFHADRAVWVFARVLGPDWPITVAASAPVPGDDERAMYEPKFRAEAETILDGIAPGDLDGVLARLAERRSHYRERS